MEPYMEQWKKMDFSRMGSIQDFFLMISRQTGSLKFMECVCRKGYFDLTDPVMGMTARFIRSIQKNSAAGSAN